jgi:hypothetical protein
MQKLMLLAAALTLAAGLSAYQYNINTSLVVDGDIYVVNALVVPAPCNAWNDSGCGPNPPSYARAMISLIKNHQYRYTWFYETSCQTAYCSQDNYAVWVARAIR